MGDLINHRSISLIFLIIVTVTGCGKASLTYTVTGPEAQSGQVRQDDIGHVDGRLSVEGVGSESPIAFGDFNDDGIVDHADFVIFQTAHGATESDQHYRLDCDFDRDGVIGFKDFTEFRRVFNGE